MNAFTNWDSELYHHGILGQKWGVRRFQNKDGSLTDKGRKRLRLKDMSDDELENQVKRLRLENEYRNLSKGRIARAFDTYRKFSTERAENKANKAKLLMAKTDAKRNNPLYRAVGKMTDSVVDSGAKAVSKAMDKASGVLVSMIPDSKQLKNGAKVFGAKVKENAPKVASAAKKAKASVTKSLEDSWYQRQRSKIKKQNPWAW